MDFKDKKMRRILKGTLGPILEKESFRGTFPNYRRIEGSTLHLLSVEFDKYGGAFFLELAKHPAEDMKTAWSPHIPVEKLTAAHIAPEYRVRLQATADTHSLPKDWFRFDGFTDESELEQLAEHITFLFSQVNDWFRSGKEGSNIYSVG